MSVQDTLEFDPGRINTRGAVQAPPPPWYEVHWDGVKAAAVDAFHDVPGRSNELRNGELAAAAAQLARLNGKDPTSYYLWVGGEPGGNAPTVNEIAFWQDLEAYRKTGHPDALKDLGLNSADYDKKRLGRIQDEAGERAKVMAQQGILGNLLGGAAGGFTDPINIITMPIGGGGAKLAGQTLGRALWNVGKSAATQGAINAGVEFAETPFRQLERMQTGRPDLTTEDVVMGVGGAFVGGAAFDAGGSALGATGRAIAATDTGQAIGRSIDNAAMAAALRLQKPDYLFTPQEAAALHMVEREAQVRDSSPYVDHYEVQAAHAAKVDAFVRGWTMPADQRAAIPPAPTTARPKLAADFDTAWNAIIGNEGGTDAAGNFLTSPKGAIGPAQVMPDTAPEAARMAGLPWDPVKYRSDPAYNIALGQAYYRDMLRQFDGDPVKAAAAYNAGAGRTRKAIAAARKAGVPGEWVSFLPPETRGYVADFRRRTGMDGGAAIAAAGADLEAPIARSPDLDAERPAVPMAGGDTGLAPQLDPAKFPDHDSWRVAQAASDATHSGLAEPLVSWRGVLEERREELLPDLRRLVGQPSRDINDVGELARELGVQPELLREAMLALAENGELVARRTGFSRPGEAGARGGKPVDVLDFIAKAGGIRDDEGHNLGLVTAVRGQDQGGKLTAQQKRSARRNREFGRRDLQRMTRHGKLLRHKGLSIDEVGELLDEAGYLHGAEGRPTTAEVLDYLEGRIASGKPAHAREDLAAGGETGGPASRDEAISFHRDALAEVAARDLGLEAGDLSPEFLDLAAEFKYDLNLDDSEALTRAINERAREAIDTFHDEGLHYDGIDYDDWPFPDSTPRGEDFADADFDGGYTSQRGGPAEGEGSAETARGRAGGERPLDPAELDEAAAELQGAPPVPHAEAQAAFDEPGAEGTKAVADSAWHDIRTALDLGEKVDPNKAAVARQELDIAAQQPLLGTRKTGQAQEAGMPEGLFAGAEQPKFDLDDGKGPRAIEDIEAELDADQAGIDAIKACLL